MRRIIGVLAGAALVAGGALLILNRSPQYISKSEAIDSCAEFAEVKNPPVETEAVFQEDHARFRDVTTATWVVNYESRTVYLSCVVDAETGKVVLGGTRSE